MERARRFFLICLLFVKCYSLEAIDYLPWGKDSLLIQSKPQDTVSCETPLIGPLSRTLITFHQRVISPADGPRSHFIPSSSQYTLDAMKHYGFFTGFAMGCDRLMRENGEEWVYQTVTNGSGQKMKWDPACRK